MVVWERGVLFKMQNNVGKKIIAFQRHIVWDSRNLDGSPVFCVAVSKSEDSLIQTELRKKLMLDCHC